MEYFFYIVEMDFGRCQPPCSHLIASEDQHGKCVRCVQAHARDVIFGISNCKYCKNFTLKTLRARHAFFYLESAVFPRHAAPEASILREAAAWSSEVELEAMDSEQISLSLPPSPGRHRANSPVQFSCGLLAPSPEARDAVSFGLEDILYTAASDSGDFGAASLDVLPSSGQEAQPSPAYTELVEVLTRATEKLSLDWPDEPRESQSSKLDERFLSGSGSCQTKRKLPFFPDLHHKVSRSWKQPFSSRLTNTAAADFTSLILQSRVPGSTGSTVPAVEDTLAAHLSPVRAVGCSMAGLITAERHLWLNLTEIREKEKAFVLDVPISSSGLFGDAVNVVIDKFRAAKTQSAAFEQFMPRRALEPASASVRALKMYVDHSRLWRQSLQLLVCFGAGRKGLAMSKHTISHWVRDAIRWPMRCAVCLHLYKSELIPPEGWLPPQHCLEGCP